MTANTKDSSIRDQATKPVDRDSMKESFGTDNSGRDGIDYGSSNNNKNKSNDDDDDDYGLSNKNIPKTMVEALAMDDPSEALRALAKSSQKKAERLAKSLHAEMKTNLTIQELPELLSRVPKSSSITTAASSGMTVNGGSSGNDGLLFDHPVSTSMMCSDSILESLTKIASGGSQASQEIMTLEQEKRELEEHAQDVETALILRKASDVATQSLSAQRYEQAARAIQSYLEVVQPSSSSSSNNSTQPQQQGGQNGTSNKSTATANSRLTPRAKAYAGEYTITQLVSSEKAVKETLLGLYQAAVQKADLMELGKLTPLVQMVRMESDAVRLYLRFLKSILSKDLENAATSSSAQQQGNTKNKQPPYVPMAKVYNAAVTILRHHLPMVSHCLHRADGDAAVVQLVHVQVEQTVEPLFQRYIANRRLMECSRNAQEIYGLLEDKYSEGQAHTSMFFGSVGGGDDRTHKRNGSDPNLDDCGFSERVGSLADVDASLEEAALCLQHAESYTRFIQHTVKEVNKARALRYEQLQEQRRIEDERKQWSTGMSSPPNRSSSSSSSSSSLPPSAGDGMNNTTMTTSTSGSSSFTQQEYRPLQILPSPTQLEQILSEVGGYYSVIERCLLIASMQRAFAADPDDPRQYSLLGSSAARGAGGSGSGGSGGGSDGSIGIGGSSGGLGGVGDSMSTSTNNKAGSRALQTSIVEACLYSTRRATQRAFATGHSGTASAVTNFAADCLRTVLVEFLTHRADDMGIRPLKPGEGLLVGSAGIFTASSLMMRQTNTVSHAVGGVKMLDDMERQQKIQRGIAYACATLNDLEVASQHTSELEKILLQLIFKGFPPTVHESLQSCVKTLTSVSDMFKLSSSNTIDSLVEVLLPRLRSIVNDAVGVDHGSSGSTTASSVVGSTTSGFSLGTTSSSMKKSSAGYDRRHHHLTNIRMNYDLDEDAYQLLEVSEGYISRLCASIDELILPLCSHLAPRLSDELVLGVLGTVCKRLEGSLKKCQFTSLGALALDSDIRDVINYAKDRLQNPQYNLNKMALSRACTPLSRLVQISKLLNVDDLDDVMDLIRSFQRKGASATGSTNTGGAGGEGGSSGNSNAGTNSGGWELKLDDAKAFLSLRVEFEASRVQELLRLPED